MRVVGTCPPDPLQDFYTKLVHEKQRSESFLDYKTVDWLDWLQQWMEDIMDAINLFAEIEADNIWKYSEKTQKEHLTLALRVLGLALQNDIEHITTLLTENFRRKLHRPKLRYWRQMTLKNRLHEIISMKCEKVMDAQNKVAKYISWYYFNILNRLYGRSQLFIHSVNADFILVMMLVHYSTRMDPSEYFGLQEEKREQLMKDFYSVMAKYQN